MKIRVMSSNIWGNCPQNRPIGDRADNHKMIVERFVPDFVGFQEYSPKYRTENEDLIKMLRDNYSELPITPENKYHNNFTPIIYRKDKFDPIDCSWLLFDGLNDMDSKSLTYGVFKSKQSDEKLIFINTHYYWTSDEAGNNARISNSKELIEVIKRLNRKYGLPVLITGDFNCTSSSAPVKALKEFGVKEAYEHSKEPVIPVESCHEYPDIFDEDSEKPHYVGNQTLSGDQEKSIDHIFFYGGITVERFVTVTDKEALSASDHCPLFADVEM